MNDINKKTPQGSAMKKIKQLKKKRPINNPIFLQLLFIFTTLLSSFPLLTFATEQLDQSNFNLGFENTKLNGRAEKWLVQGDHHPIIFDSTDKIEGQYSLHLTTNNSELTTPMSYFSQTIYAKFDRNFITFSCYINYQPLQDSSSFQLHFTTYEDDQFNNDDLDYNGVTQYISHMVIQPGLAWQKVELTIPIQQEVVYVTFGGVLSGKAELRVDDVNISFERNSIEQANNAIY